MAGIMDLLAAARGGQAPQGAPQPQQGQPQQPGANSLAALMAQKQQQQPQPAPNRAQTVAAMHYFGEIKQALMPVINDPNLGSKNIRPKLLDAVSKLLGAKVLSLSEIMNKIKNFPDDPIEQKKFIENIVNMASQAQDVVLMHHRDAPPEPYDAEQWSPDNHEANMSGLMAHYGGRNG